MHFKISEINPDRWEELDRLFQAAIDLEPPQRTDFIAQACSGDPVLREEIESLLRSDADGWSFLEEPALQLAAPFVASQDQPQLHPGQTIGDYQILDAIGRGGMGEIYLAKDLVLNRRVALKLLPAEYTRDQDRLLRFQNEAQAASALNHPNILTIYQWGSFEGLQFIVTEFVEGETIRELIKGQRLNVQQVLDVVIQIASALTAAHKAGIVHRDIKPENVMLRPDGYVKVLDFGLAKLAEAPAVAGGQSVDLAAASHANISSALLMGTVRYMSPEQARGLRVDARSDIFSLGVMLYEMIAGRAPFENNDVTRLVESILHEEPRSLAQRSEKIPADLVAVTTKALTKDREQRYQSADELLIDLRALKPVRQKAPTSTFNRFTSAITSAIKGHKVVASMTLVLIVLASVGGYVWYKRYGKAASVSANAGKYVFTGRWTAKGSIAVPRRDAELAVLDGNLYVAGGSNICTYYANLESYDPASNRWMARAPMHTARGGLGLAALDGLLYAVGGRLNCDSQNTASVEAYDPKTDRWTERAPLPVARGGEVLAALNGKLYAIGGENGAQKLDLNTEYDPATDTWIERAPLPSPRIGAAVVVVDKLIYVIGGGQRAEDLTSVIAYDPATDRWTSKAPMPIGRAEFGAAFLNGKIYAFGGSGNSGQVDAYDPVIDSWSTGPSMPSARGGFRAVTLNGSIYFAGGQDESSHLASVMSFTPCSDNGTWITKAPMPTARSAAIAAQVDGTIFVIGGYTAPLHYHTENEAYNPATNTWTKKAPMPTARTGIGTNGAVVAGKIYVIGGNNGYASNANEAYDPKTDTWTVRKPMPTPRAHLAVVSVDGLIYAIGGANTSGNIRYQTVEVYNPAKDSWTTAPPMPTGRDLLVAGVINDIIYVAGGYRLTAGALNTLEAFDPKSGKWTTKAPLPTPRIEAGAAVVNDALFVLGGLNNLTPVSTIDVYDPSTNSWTTLTSTFPNARHQVAVSTINHALYAIGGFQDYEGNKLVPNNDEFIPPQCWAQ